MTVWAIYLTAAAVGACVGSWLSTWALRAARGEQSTRGRSRCDHCQTELSFARTTPVLAYVLQGGRCANCAALIDPLHLVGEIAGAAVATSALAVVASSPGRAGLLIALGLVLLAGALIDARTRRLPDALTGAAAILCLALLLLGRRTEWIVGLAAAAVMGIVLLALRSVFARRGGDAGLGLGDVKLLSGTALWLGLAAPWALASAAVMGLCAVALLRPTDRRIPFGPSIAASVWVVGLVGEAHPWPRL